MPFFLAKAIGIVLTLVMPSIEGSTILAWRRPLAALGNAMTQETIHLAQALTLIDCPPDRPVPPSFEKPVVPHDSHAQFDFGFLHLIHQFRY